MHIDNVIFLILSKNAYTKFSAGPATLDTWENVSFDDKRRVVDLMITTIAATSDSLNITWKI